RFYSPLVLNIAGKEGIGMAELENIPGTGNEGRVTKKDILNYVSNRGGAPVPPQPKPQVTPVAAPVQEIPQQPQPAPFAAPAQQPAPAAQPQPAAQPVSVQSGNVEIIEMDR